MPNKQSLRSTSSGHPASIQPSLPTINSTGINTIGTHTRWHRRERAPSSISTPTIEHHGAREDWTHGTVAQFLTTTVAVSFTFQRREHTASQPPSTSSLNIASCRNSPQPNMLRKSTTKYKRPSSNSQRPHQTENPQTISHYPTRVRNQQSTSEGECTTNFRG